MPCGPTNVESVGKSCVFIALMTASIVQVRSSVSVIVHEPVLVREQVSIGLPQAVKRSPNVHREISKNVFFIVLRENG